MNGRRVVIYWMPVVAWMIAIFIFSTDLGSAEHTSRYLVPFLHWIDPHISARAVASIQFAIRKAAHLTEYAVLALLLVRAWQWNVREHFWRGAAVTLMVAALYAATDEWHQSFTPSRTASPRDVMIDTCGALIGLVIYRLAMARVSKPQPVSALR